jgi:hypothetical protein
MENDEFKFSSLIPLNLWIHFTAQKMICGSERMKKFQLGKGKEI